MNEEGATMGGGVFNLLVRIFAKIKLNSCPYPARKI